MQNRLTNDFKLFISQFADPIIEILICSADLVFSIYVVLTFNVWLLSVIIILAVIMLFLPNLLTRKLEQATVAVSSTNQQYLDVIEKWLSGLAILQRYKVKNKLLNVLTKSSSNLESSTINEEKRETQLSSLEYGTNIFSQVLVLILAGILILNHQLNFGAFFSIGNFASLIFSQLVTITSQIGKIKSSRQLGLDITSSLNLFQNKKQPESREFSKIIIQDLKLKFDNGEELIYPNIVINKGEKILLSGDSGTGKSTLFKLILGEFKPSSGKIEFFNKEKKVNLSRSTIGYIPQDPYLFPGTIEDNITMFNKN